MEELPRWVMWLLALAAVIAALAAVRWLLPRRDPVETLKQDYLKRLRQPPAQAKETLDRQLERVMQKFPGKSADWYLRWLLADLKRDRR